MYAKKLSGKHMPFIHTNKFRYSTSSQSLVTFPSFFTEQLFTSFSFFINKTCELRIACQILLYILKCKPCQGNHVHFATSLNFAELLAALRECKQMSDRCREITTSLGCRLQIISGPKSTSCFLQFSPTKTFATSIRCLSISSKILTIDVRLKSRSLRFRYGGAAKLKRKK